MFGWQELLRLFGFSLSHGLALGDVGSAVSIGSSVLGGILGDDASGDAADASNAGLLEAIKELRRVDDRTREDTKSYRALGDAATNRLGYLLGFDLGQNRPLTASEVSQAAGLGYDQGYRYPGATREDVMNNAVLNWKKGDYGDDANTRKLFNIAAPEATDKSDGQFGSLLNPITREQIEADPVYSMGLDFGLNNGIKAINNRALANGSFDSGAAAKAIAQWGNDYGTTKAGEAYGRQRQSKLDTANLLTGGSNIGQNAINTSANVGTSIGSAIAGAQQQIGANNAASTIGSANAFSNALGGVTNAFGDWWNKNNSNYGFGTGYGNASPGVVLY